MKKIILLASAIAMAFALNSCQEKNNNGLDLDNVILDGFYVYGDATGNADKVLSENAMAAGINEADEDKKTRTGMYEKYIYLEGGKDFALIENSAGNKKFYGANLVEVNYGKGTDENPGKNFDSNPDMMIFQGKLIIGESAPAMQVKESGLYHILLDNNTLGDLGKDGAQIVIHKAEWGIRGGMNNWGFTKGEETNNGDGSITYTWKNQTLAAKGEFKFASCNGWKINLDENGTVKAEVSLGVKDGKLAVGAGNISIDKAGIYDFSLTYTPKAGALGNSFTYSTTLTLEFTFPLTNYLVGEGIGENAAPMIAAHSEPGAYWAIRHIEAGKKFKVSSSENEKDAIKNLKDNTGKVSTEFTVPETGLYMIETDYINETLHINKAEVYGMGDVFGNWTEGENAFTANGQTFTATASAAGNLRSYAKSFLEGTAGNWWHREFIIIDGKIDYRADGGDQPAVALTAGQTITYDFNAGTGSIK